MPAFVYRPAGRGVRFRPPRVRVYRRRCHAPLSGRRPRFGRAAFDPRVSAREMRWACNGELSTLSLTVQLGAGVGLPERLRPERAERRTGVGDGVVLTRPVSADGRLSAVAEELFCGTIGRVRPLIAAGPDREAFEATAYGPELRLRQKAVSGQWCKTVARDDAELAGEADPGGARRGAVAATDLPAVFNPGGSPNATAAGFRLATIHDHPAVGAEHNRCRAFETPDRRAGAGGAVAAVHWSAAAALRSLIEYVDDYDAVSPATDWAAIERLLDGAPLGEVAVEGLSLLEAVRAVLLPLGFAFALEPWRAPAAWGGPVPPTDTDKHRLIVFRLHRSGRRRCPYAAPVHGGNVAAGSRAGQRAQVQRLDFVRDARRVANAVTVVGDLRRRQAVLEFTPDPEARELHPFWDLDAHDLADWANADGVVDPRSDPPWTQAAQETFFKRYNDGTEHPLYRHVFRTFAWNEDGALAPVIEVAADLGGFGAADGVNWVRRPRPVGRTFLHDEGEARVRTYPATVQLGIDGDADSWVPCPAAVLPDRAGVTIARAALHDWYPYDRHDVPQALRDLYGSTGSAPVSYLTALHNALTGGAGPKLRLRLIGSIECDEAVRGVAPRRAGGAWPWPAERVVRAPDRFRWRDVAEGAFALGADRHDARDDRAAAAAAAAALRAAGEHCRGRGSLRLRGIVRAFRPGDAVGQTAGRRFDLSVDAPGGRAGPVITAVRYDFRTAAGKTELVLAAPGETP